MSPARPLILVVDDDAGIRSLLTDILQDLGYEPLFGPGDVRFHERTAAR